MEFDMSLIKLHFHLIVGSEEIDFHNLTYGHVRENLAHLNSIKFAYSNQIFANLANWKDFD